MTLRKVWLLVAALSFVLFMPLSAHAQAEQEGFGGMIELPPITPGGGRFVTPIAVPEANNLGQSDPEALSVWIGTTIRNSLSISGFFDVFGPDRFFFDPAREGMSTASINFQNWYNVGAQALIKTAFSVAGNQVSLDFRLFSVDERDVIDIGFANRTVPIDRVKAETYRFINLVIKYYTGAEGIFGTRIAYTGPDASGNKQIYLTTMDGTGTSAVTSYPTNHIVPGFGPGGELMYTSYRNGSTDLFIGRNDARVFSGRPGINMTPRLSPRGDEIALTLSVDGTTEIYVTDLEGNILRRCTDNNNEDVSPTWSPDGRQIAFNSDRGGTLQIYVMNSDCSNQRRVTFQGNYNASPDWSPQGDRIAFSGRDRDGRFDIFTVDPTTNMIERLTQDQGDNRYPSWSPDGRYLVFTSNRGVGRAGGRSGGALFIMTEDGQSQTQILAGTFETPVWER